MKSGIGSAPIRDHSPGTSLFRDGKSSTGQARLGTRGNKRGRILSPVVTKTHDAFHGRLSRDPYNQGG